MPPHWSARRSSSGRSAATGAASLLQSSPRRPRRSTLSRGDLARLVDEIIAHGAQVKDLDSGLVDFPALHHGETVLLCWQLGEDEIAWWHRVDDGFAGRRPLPLD